MQDVSGVDGAAPIWREVMDFLQDGAMPAMPAVPRQEGATPIIPAVPLQEGATPATPRTPDGIVRQRVHYAGALEPDRHELFIAGTERSEIVMLSARSAHAKIESPSNGAIYAIDPDIPAANQRLIVSARGAPKGARFVFEDGRQARADKPAMWLPEPGKREVALKSADGKELDRVKFEVRGLRATRRNGFHRAPE
jgi:penicillin-binding protein 1C